MGYFSQHAIELDTQEYITEKPTDIKREILEYYLDDLTARLYELDRIRPHNRLDPQYDGLFYSDAIVHYNENPQTVQDILFGIAEVKELLWELECYERTTAFEREKEAELAMLDQAHPEQLLLVAFWNYGFLFCEANAYKSALKIMKSAC